MMEQAYRRLLQDEPGLLKECTELLHCPLLGPNSNFGPVWNLVGQSHRSGEGDLFASLAMLRLLPLLVAGDMVINKVPLTRGPGADKDQVGNQRILDQLSGGFSAEFVGGKTMDSDGTFSWSKPLRVEVPVRKGHVLIEPGNARFEVGTTSGSTTMMHLAQCWVLARWPYGCDYIALMFMLEWMPTSSYEKPQKSPFMLEDHREPPDEAGLERAAQIVREEEIQELEARLRELRGP